MFDFKNKIKNPSASTEQLQNSQDLIKTKKIETQNKDEKNGETTVASEKSEFDAKDVKVHVMPQKFLSEGSQKIKPQAAVRPGARKITGIKRDVLIGVIVGGIIICMLGLAAWFLLKTIESPKSQRLLSNQNNSVQQKPKPSNNLTTNSTTPTNLITGEKPKPKEVCSADNCELCNRQECLELSEYCHVEDLCLLKATSTAPGGAEERMACPNYVCVSGPAEAKKEKEETKKLTLSRDSDFDLLTDVEEGLWGTDPLNSDTDNDGYNDGIEIENLYNPLVAGSGTGKLIESDLVKVFTNSKYGYSIYYPKSWQVNNSDASQVSFISNTGEFIQVIVQENYAGFSSAKEWYLTQNPNVDKYKLKEILIGNWVGVRSPDELNVYLINNNYIYILTMNIGLKTELNYKTTFEMMLKSFQLFESPLY